jgi:Protein of unknown function (DUF3105)
MRAWRIAERGSARARVAVAGYVAVWMAATAVLAAGLLLLLDDDGREQVSLPTIHEPGLVEAARRAGCRLRRTGRRERMDPPAAGPAASEPARAGFYDKGLDPDSVVAALREGVVVIHFRANLDGTRIEELRRIQESAPTGTIVAANATMPFEVAATAYRRVLGCPRASDEAIEAALLFRGRFLGSGPG